MLFNSPPARLDPLRAAINGAFLRDEAAAVDALLGEPLWDATAARRVGEQAAALVAAVRSQRRRQDSLDAFLHEYDLSSLEGVMLMCLAEGLLRIPDGETADRLIRDKLGKGVWDNHLGKSHSLLVNASTWGLMLTGRLVTLGLDRDNFPAAILSRLAARLGEPLVRLALRHAMGILGRQFVMGRTIREAVERSYDSENKPYRHSFDMLGEAAVTAKDADRYTAAYVNAIASLSMDAAAMAHEPSGRPGISVKLSALHPRYEFAQRDHVMADLTPRLLNIVEHAHAAGVGLTLDAEEADRLDLSLDLFASVIAVHGHGDWQGFGLAVQAYQKRALPVLDWLIGLARRCGRRIPVRLVKGAYWDTEIKRAQQAGLLGYPVYTRKVATDVSYLHCAKKMLAATDAIYPQFATHNAHTVAAVIELAGVHDFEFQRLHGMGEGLYHHLLHNTGMRHPCRVYAPVGGHQDLLPYLVRRLLENGANTSFVNRVEDERTPLAKVIADPVTELGAVSPKPNPRIPLPTAIYRDRRNPAGINFADPEALSSLDAAMTDAAAQLWQATPVVGGRPIAGEQHSVMDPADRRRRVGLVIHADDAAVGKAIALAAEAAPQWDHAPALRRAETLECAANLFEQHRPELMALCVREGGKTVADALAEVREAADYCRYYAALGRRDFAVPRDLPGPTGERNTLHYRGRGVFACISPWNFPLAIFTGQVTAALMAGNAVLAKPAGQTALVAHRAVQLLHEAGVPTDVLHFLPGAGRSVGPLLTRDERITGIAFTGSTDTARGLQRGLAARNGAIVPLIAETGGMNAMIVDSSALPEQVVKDVLRSAFNSAGQRCSALRVLFLQHEVADKIIDLLAGSMADLHIGDPALLATDVGPVIDDPARDTLIAHATRMEKEAKLIYRSELPPDTSHGSFFAPCAFEIEKLSQLQQEVFGPILHVIRYSAGHLNDVIEAINASGYGLTLGIHSRIDETVQHIQQHARVGNCYVNRDMVGAVVGVQPFGGEGLSGTGPKAGGPNYLRRFAVERTLTVNTAAVGGNADLLSMDE